MNHHFVTDNSFLLSGLRGSGLIQKRDITFHHIKDDVNNLTPSLGDVVALSIKNVLLRKRVLRYLGRQKYRIILLLKMNPIYNNSCNKKFPWLISETTSLDELRSILDKAAQAENIYREISENEAFIIRSLCDGNSMPQLNILMGLSEKYVYRLRSNLISEYKLQGHNAMTTLICRDVITLSKVTS
ncbi:TPA: hypothetical protein LVM22_001052 [Klebsiella oxytoca]|nr:hypothetical protein [Klebsiella oxytoca]